MERFREVFAGVRDPRAKNAWHDLVEVLFIALGAVLCGAQSCADMELFGRAKEPLLRRFLRLEHGVPSHDTFSRVFRILDPATFESAFRRFMDAFTASLKGVVALDGKALRGAFERGRKTTPLHLVNVFAAEARLAIGQRRAPGRDEVKAALEILELLSLRGCIVTADALHCHGRMAEAIQRCGAAYVLALKENQSGLFADAEALFHNAPEPPTATRTDPASHGRDERRSAQVLSAGAIARKRAFPGLAAIARIVSQRRSNAGETTSVRYFLLSRRFSPQRILKIVRSHWSIENQLHWTLDVVFDEDRARNRKDNGPENLAILRKLALNMVRTNPAKGSVRGKIKRAGWDDTFLISLFGQMR